MAALDDVLLAAYQLRESLVSQGRRFDDETAARADALLEQIRKERES